MDCNCLYRQYRVTSIGFFFTETWTFGPKHKKFWSKSFRPKQILVRKFWSIFEKLKNFGQSSFGPIFKTFKFWSKQFWSTLKKTKILVKTILCPFLRNQNIWLIFVESQTVFANGISINTKLL